MRGTNAIPAIWYAPLLGIASVLFGLFWAGSAQSRTVDPLALYGREIRFDVVRDNQVIGFHRVRFGKSGADLVVDSRFHVAVKVLVFEACRFEYQSRSQWRNGPLVGMTATTNDNGKQTALNARGKGDGLLVDSSAGNYSLERVAADLIRDSLFR